MDLVTEFCAHLGGGGVGAKGWNGTARETELVRGEGEETISAIDMENSH